MSQEYNRLDPMTITPEREAALAQLWTTPSGFEYRQIPTPYGFAGIWRWYHGDDPMCDHEHSEQEPTCEDARIEMSNIRARGAA